MRSFCHLLKIQARRFVLKQKELNDKIEFTASTRYLPLRLKMKVFFWLIIFLLGPESALNMVLILRSFVFTRIKNYALKTVRRFDIGLPLTIIRILSQK
jgi:hypothetical protein